MNFEELPLAQRAELIAEGYLRGLDRDQVAEMYNQSGNINMFGNEEEIEPDYESPQLLNNYNYTDPYYTEPEQDYPVENNMFSKGGSKETKKSASKSSRREEFLANYDRAWKNTKYDSPQWRAFWDKMARLESGYSPYITNSIGAKGYFQLMPFNRSTEWNDPTQQFGEAQKLMNGFENQFTEEDYRRGAQQGYNKWQMLAGAWYGGVGGVRKTLAGMNIGRDGYSVLDRMNDFADIGEVNYIPEQQQSSNSFLDYLNSITIDTDGVNKAIASYNGTEEKDEDTPFYDSRKSVISAEELLKRSNAGNNTFANGSLMMRSRKKEENTEAQEWADKVANMDYDNMLRLKRERVPEDSNMTSVVMMDDNKEVPVEDHPYRLTYENGNYVHASDVFNPDGTINAESNFWTKGAITPEGNMYITLPEIEVTNVPYIDIYEPGFFDGMSDDAIVSQIITREKNVLVQPRFSGKNYYLNYNPEYDDDLDYSNDVYGRYSRKSYYAEPRYKAELLKYDPEKAITLTNAGNLTGAHLSTNILDYLLKLSRETGVSFQEVLGMAARESGLGSGTTSLADRQNAMSFVNIKDDIKQNLLESGFSEEKAEEIANKTMKAPIEYSLKNDGSITSDRLITVNRIFYPQNEYDDVLAYFYNSDLYKNMEWGSEEFLKYLEQEEARADRKYEARKGKAPIDPVYQFLLNYKANPKSANPGNPGYPDQIRKLGTIVFNSPEVQKWYNENYRDLGGKIKKFEEGGAMTLDEISLLPYEVYRKHLADRFGISVEDLEKDDYNYREFYAAYPHKAWDDLLSGKDFHFPDKYKLYTHPTASDQSILIDDPAWMGRWPDNYNYYLSPNRADDPDLIDETLHYIGMEGKPINVYHPNGEIALPSLIVTPQEAYPTMKKKQREQWMGL